MIKKQEFPIASLLPVGKENAITTTELLKLSGIGNSRDLQRQIASEREHGAIICSGSGAGYWRPKDLQEIRTFVQVMDLKAFNTLKAAAGARKLLREKEGRKNGE